MNSSLDIQLKRLRKRVRLLLAERYGLFGMAVGAVVAAVVVALSSRYEALLSYSLWAVIVIAGAVAGVAWGLLRRLDDLTVAVAADKRTGLKERLSSAIAVEDGPMAEALVTDAGARISELRSREVFRHRFGLPHAVCGAALFVLLAVIVGPMLPVFQSQTRRQEVAVMKTEGKKLIRVAKEINKQDTKHEQLRKLAQKLGKLGAKMSTGRMTKKQAMLQSQKLAKDIKKEQDRLAQMNSPSKTMDQAQADMRKAAEELAKRMADKLAAEKHVTPELAMEQVPSDQQLASLARKDGALSESERKQLEQALGRYADPNNTLPIPAELGEALAKLAANKDYQAAMELMQKLAAKMGSGKMGKMDREMLKQQLEALAKALKGTDLDKLAKMLKENAEKLAKMSPAELKKMLENMKAMQLLAKAGGT
jgi:hypothetical protein